MERKGGRIVLGAGLLVASLMGGPSLPATPANAAGVGSTITEPAGGTGAYLLTATDTGAAYAPTFTGNGELGVRVPSSGQGYEGGKVVADAELAGFYARDAGGVQQRANVPAWSTLTYSDGGQSFVTSVGHTSRWRQWIDLRSGVVTTSTRWTAPNGHVTDLTYQVLTDRARQQVGLVRLVLTPRWTGTASVTDMIDGSSATKTTQLDKGWSPADRRDWITVRTVGTNITAAIASQLSTSASVRGATNEIGQSTNQSIGQELAFPIVANHHYTLTKYVGVTTSQQTGDPRRAAEEQASQAATTGYESLLSANNAAWAKLWSGRIDVIGNATLATEVNASEFYLWSSTRDGVDWSVSPAGLSSNGYDGHVFWDAETWMYPALLAQHPDLAAAMNAYRFQRLGAAQMHATDSGYQGARYPWESALDGTEQVPPPVSLFTEGLYELHVTADIALAQWQFFLATGDTRWLARFGRPVLSRAAAFWASRVTPGSNGTYHISGVTGPDEENPDVNDEAYTNATAKLTLLDAARAARILGQAVPAAWTRIAAGIVVPVPDAAGVQPEFLGYGGQMVKQADVTLLQYPWSVAIPSSTEQSNLNYYAPRTDPNGPSMSDSVNSIDSAELGTSGCSSFVFTQRSVEPFIRDNFDQFSETRGGGVFTFVTGIGGFLQEFLYGYSGLRWNADNVQLAPSLTGQLGSIVLHGLAWHGRRFTVAIGQHTTTLTLTGGTTLPVKTQFGTRTLTQGQSVTTPTRRPDRMATDDMVRCGKVSATTSRPGAPALAAVDGSPATGWQAVSVPATLTAPLAGSTRHIGTATLRWGQRWPSPPSPTQAAPPGPITTLRAVSYTLTASVDGRSWHTIASVVGRTSGTTDVLHFPPVPARYIALHIAADGPQPPVLDELTITP